MSVTILEALQNAEENLCKGTISFQLAIGKAQLSNAVGLLLKGYSLEDEVEPLLETFGSVEQVPEKEPSRGS